MTIYDRALALHKQNKGKIAISTKVPMNTVEDLALAYSPGVAEPCRKIAADLDDAYTYTNKGNTVAVITDGSAVLGLGNIGPEAALPVMEGKAALFKRFADVDAIPICLATQDTEDIIAAVKAIAPGLGGINLEDISAPRCFEIENRLKKELPIPVFHDDQHGTAIVVLAGLINALKLAGKELAESNIVISGVGAAGVAITKLLVAYGAMAENILLVDSRGVIHKGRENLNDVKQMLADMTNVACHLSIDAPGCVTGTLADAVAGADVFVGVSQPNVLTKDMVHSMNEKPIIFALSNPEPEISPDDAKDAGAFVIATGRSDYPNQVNNVLAFPGIFRGVLDARATQITEEMKIAAAKAIADSVADPSVEKIIPGVFEDGVADTVAKAVRKAA